MGVTKKMEGRVTALLNTRIEPRSPLAGQRVAIGDVMKFEILINEKSRLWIFHDLPMPSRLAWLEFNPLTGQLDFIPHDMSEGMLYADVPAALHSKLKTSTLAYLYLTDGEKVTGFQKAPVQIRRV